MKIYNNVCYQLLVLRTGLGSCVAQCNPTVLPDYLPKVSTQSYNNKLREKHQKPFRFWALPTDRENTVETCISPSVYL